MAKYLIVLLFAVVTMTARAGEPLTNGQAAMEAAYMVALMADRSQTLQIRHFCDDKPGCAIREANPLLGSNPSTARINKHFAGVAFAHYLITRALPPEYRAGWQAGSLAVELVVVGHNRRLGLHVRF